MGRYRYELSSQRVVLCIDVDCFAVQVYQRHRSGLRSEPCITTHKLCDDNRNPRIVSVNTIAKRYGITRDDRLMRALEKCPNLQVFEQEIKYNKTWTRKEEMASDDILDVMRRFCRRFGDSVIIDRNSIDGFLLDITDICNDNCLTFRGRDLKNFKVLVEGGKRQFYMGYQQDMLRSPLAFAAFFTRSLYEEIEKETKFETSIGISCNPLLAKICCEVNKPNHITIIRSKAGIARVMKDSQVRDIPGFKMKFGEEICKLLRTSNPLQLRSYSKNALKSILYKKYRKESSVKADKVWNTCRGIDDTPVRTRYMFKTVNNSRTYTKGIKVKDNLQDLHIECMAFEDKLLFDSARNNRIALTFKVVLTDRNGRTHTVLNTRGTTDIEYKPTEVYQTVKALVLAKPEFNDKYFYKISFIAFEFDVNPIDVNTHERAVIALEDNYQEFMARNETILYINSVLDFDYHVFRKN